MFEDLILAFYLL